jgi:hypothetical protein
MHVCRGGDVWERNMVHHLRKHITDILVMKMNVHIHQNDAGGGGTAGSPSKGEVLG